VFASEGSRACGKRSSRTKRDALDGNGRASVGTLSFRSSRSLRKAKNIRGSVGRELLLSALTATTRSHTAWVGLIAVPEEEFTRGDPLRHESAARSREYRLDALTLCIIAELPEGSRAEPCGLAHPNGRAFPHPEKLCGAFRTLSQSCRHPTSPPACRVSRRRRTN
jgi:hypothetical protein